MACGGPVLKPEQGAAQVFNDEVVAPVWNLPVEILHAVDKGAQDLLQVRPCVVAGVAWVAEAFAFDEHEAVLRRDIALANAINPIAAEARPAVQPFELIDMTWVNNFHRATFQNKAPGEAYFWMNDQTFAS